MVKKVLGKLWPVFMVMALVFLFVPEVQAEETEIQNSTTKAGADACNLTVGQEYLTTLTGVPGYVSFVTPAKEGYVVVDWANVSMDGQQKCYITDAEGKIVGQFNYSSGLLEFKSETGYRNNAQMAPNTRYYIQIGDDESRPNGKAWLQIRFAEDDCANGLTGAKEVETGTAYTGGLDAESSRDKDYYKVTAVKSGIHRIYIKNVSMTNQIAYELLDSSGKTLDTIAGATTYKIVYNWGTGDSYIDVQLEKGKTYYLCISGYTNTYSFTVSCQTVESVTMKASVTLKKWESYQLEPKVLPKNAFNTGLNYESSNTSVATVDNTGKITAAGTGKAIITATTVDGSNISAKCTVYVKPEAPTGVKGTKSTTSTIKLKWSSVKKAAGYTIYQKKNGKWVKLGTTTKKTYTVKKLKAATGYQFKIQAYMKLDGKTFTSGKSDICYYATKPKSTSITKFTRKAKKTQGLATYYSVKIQWKKVAGIKKYLVFYKLAGSDSIELLGTYSGTSATVYLEWYSGSKKCTFYVAPQFTYKGEYYIGTRSKGKSYTFK